MPLQDTHPTPAFGGFGFSTPESSVRNTEPLRVPEVDAGLITDLYFDAEILESCRTALDDPILSLPAEVVKVAVEDIVIGDTVVQREPAHMVPDSLT